MVDTLHDLPNLLWEVANESSGGGRHLQRLVCEQPPYFLVPSIEAEALAQLAGRPACR